MLQVNNRPVTHSAPENSTAQAFIESLNSSLELSTPYRHWLLSHALPDDVAQAVTELPWPPPVIEDTHGTREANNATRTHFNVERRSHFPICDEIATAFQGH